jgi:hypothetical protein
MLILTRGRRSLLPHDVRASSERIFGESRAKRLPGPVANPGKQHSETWNESARCYIRSYADAVMTWTEAVKTGSLEDSLTRTRQKLRL